MEEKSRYNSTSKLDSISMKHMFCVCFCAFNWATHGNLHPKFNQLSSLMLSLEEVLCFEVLADGLGLEIYQLQ